MNKRLYLILLMLVVVKMLAQSKQLQTINNNWEFHKGDISVIPADIAKENSTDSWQRVTIPHTWNNVDAVDDTPGYFRGACWYKKSIVIDAKQKDDNARTLIYFEGANQVTNLYINGQWVGQHQGGYTRFHFDITKFLKFGEKNILAVKVDNSYNKDIAPLTADFTFFGGIYRDVFLVTVNEVHFSMDDFSASGVFVTTPTVSKDQAKVLVKTLISNETNQNKTVVLVNRIMDKNGKLVAEKTQKVKINKNEKNVSFLKEILIDKPQLWSPNTPYLYQVVTQIKDAKTGQILEESVESLGIRWFKFDPEKGFFLNGEYLKLIGTNRHQDFLNKGNALTDEMHIRDIRLLKEMGGNFLRISHYPQDPTVLEMCDRLGILASVEIPIVNAITESKEFTDNCLFMAEEMVKQNYNHPSLIIWAYMNEVLLRVPFDENKDKERYTIYVGNVKKLASKIENRIRELDPNRYTMIVNHGGIERYKNAGITDVPMILGWNQYQGWYGGEFVGFDTNLNKFHAEFPNQSIIITEYGADVHNRLHSFESERFDYTVEYGNKYHEHYLKAIMDRRYIVGANIWNLNDFYSETRGYARPRTNLKGITTLDREKKDTWWLYKTVLSDKPIIKFGQNEWKIRGGVANLGTTYCTQPITVYSNGSAVQLTHNDVVYNAEVRNSIAHFSVPFVNGKNKLEAKTSSESKNYTDLLEVDFRLAPNKFSEFKDDFYELNVLLGSKRIYEDRVKSQVWIPEQQYSAGSWGYIGGEPYRPKTKYGSLPSSELDIIDTEDDPVYQTQRVGIEKFKLDVPDGKYVISLHWAELESDSKHEKLVYNLGDDKVSEAATMRVFNVLVNNEYIEKNLNITEQYGAEKAIVKRYEIVVSNGKGITIDFEKIKGNTVLNAIQIRKL